MEDTPLPIELASLDAAFEDIADDCADIFDGICEICNYVRTQGRLWISSSRFRTKDTVECDVEKKMDILRRRGEMERAERCLVPELDCQGTNNNQTKITTELAGRMECRPRQV